MYAIRSYYAFSALHRTRDTRHRLVVPYAVNVSMGVSPQRFYTAVVLTKSIDGLLPYTTEGICSYKKIFKLEYPQLKLPVRRKRLQMLEIRLSLLRFEKGCGKGVFSRITSYNVCYTKLLRTTDSPYACQVP